MKYRELQEEWIKNNGINPGDNVVVVRSAVDDERGWDNHWATEMNNMIGKIYKIKYISDSGIIIGNYSFPYFSLFPVRKGSDGNIKTGNTIVSKIDSKCKTKGKSYIVIDVIKDTFCYLNDEGIMTYTNKKEEFLVQ